MSRLKTILAWMLIAALSLSMFAGCAGIHETQTPGIPEELENARYNVKTEIPDSQYDFLKDGQSDYQIVLADQPDDNEKFAAEELQYFVLAASGANLNVIPESEALGNGRYIYIGSTQAAATAGAKPTYALVKNNGYQIKLVDDDCYLCGYGSVGTRNAVYGFLDQIFDFEVYAADEIVYTSLKTVKMPAFDLMTTPAFDWRQTNYGNQIWHDKNGERFQMNDGTEIFVTGYVNHNSFEIISPTIYDYTSEAYKDWFSPNTWTNYSGVLEPVQLCYSNEEMAQEFIKNLIDTIKDAPQTSMLIGQQDNHAWCECEKCTALKEKYGTNAAVMIHFTNKVQAAVDAWFAENKPGVEPTRLVMFAYNATVEAPAKFDEATQTWVPLDETMKLNEHSSVMIAPAWHAWNEPIEDSDISDRDTLHGLFAGWSSICDHPYAWLYTLYYLGSGGMVLFNTIEVAQKNYQYLQSIGTMFLLDQAEHYESNYTAWGNAKCYVLSKLHWDPSLHVGELLDDFFENYFGEASETMQELFNENRQWTLYCITKDPSGLANITGDMVSTKYWSYNQLKRYLEQINQAYDDIAPLAETDPERYAQLYDRILTESLQYRYLILQLYSTEYDTAAQLQEERLAFKNDFERLKLSRVSEQISAESIWSSWGLLD